MVNDPKFPTCSIPFRRPLLRLAIVIYLLGVLCGLEMLIVPEFLAVRYFLFSPILSDRSGSALQALRGSAVLGEGHWWAAGALLLIVSLLNLAGAAVLGLGLIITFPVSLLAISGFYRSLQQTAA